MERINQPYRYMQRGFPMTEEKIKRLEGAVEYVRDIIADSNSEDWVNRLLNSRSVLEDALTFSRSKLLTKLTVSDMPGFRRVLTEVCDVSGKIVHVVYGTDSVELYSSFSEENFNVFWTEFRRRWDVEKGAPKVDKATRLLELFRKRDESSTANLSFFDTVINDIEELCEELIERRKS